MLKFTYAATDGVVQGRGQLKLSDDAKSFNGTFTMDADIDKTPIGIRGTRIEPDVTDPSFPADVAFGL